MNCCEQHKPYGCNQGRECPVRYYIGEDGGHAVNGSISMPLHRQVMPPEPPQKPTPRENTFTCTEWAARVLLWIVGAAALAAVLHGISLI